MTRFAWIQSRTQTLTALALVAALAIVAAITGVQLAHLSTSLVANCQTGCDLAASRFVSHDRFLQTAFDLLALLMPALVGVFWGAPLLARELESGTFRLAWTQSVTRTRWLATRLAVGGAGAVVLAGLLSLTITWWYRSVDVVGSNQYELFERRDVAPIAYAAFAFAAGALLGAVIRRTVPAMAATLGVYVFARIATSLWVRPHLLSPVRRTMSLLGADRFGFSASNGGPLTLDAGGSGPHNAWTLSSRLLTGNGHRATSAQLAAFLHQHCPGIVTPPVAAGPGKEVRRLADPAGFEACRQQAAHTFHLLVTYQPAGRYWTFQWLEVGVFLALAAVAVAGCFWWVNRRA